METQNIINFIDFKDIKDIKDYENYEEGNIDNICIIGVEYQWCCKNSEYYKWEIEGYELRDEYINIFKNGKKIELCESNFFDKDKNIYYPFFHNNTKLIPVTKNEYDSYKAKVTNIFC